MADERQHRPTPVPVRIRRDPELYAAYLEARVAGLEAALARRSEVLRKIQDHLPARELIAVARLVNGLPPLPRYAHDAESWRETTELVQADVEDSLKDLWRSLAPAESPPDEMEDAP